MTAEEEFMIGQLRTTELSAVRTLAARHNLEAWFQTAIASSTLTGPTCIVATKANQLTGFILTRWLADGVGSLAGPVFAGGDRGSAAGLLRGSAEWFCQHDARLVTSLRSIDEPLSGELRQAGFQTVARIAFMVATNLDPIGDPPPFPPASLKPMTGPSRLDGGLYWLQRLSRRWIARHCES